MHGDCDLTHQSGGYSELDSRNSHQWVNRPKHVEPLNRVVLKIGGSLITSKQQLKSFNHPAMQSVAAAVRELIGSRMNVIIVHGAGGFGHLRARRWELATGYRSDFRPKKEWLEEDGIATQLEAVELVRADMDQLCTAFCAALREAGVDSRIQPPRNWATGVGPNFKGDINCLSSNLDEPVVVTFGDVVQCSGEGRFGILSGDDIAFRAATELPAVAALVFAVGEVEGLLTAPPGAENSELIESWWPEQHYIGRHSDSSDVTGGIELKVQRAANAALIVPQVWIVDGRHPDRIVKAARGATPRGTRVLASEP